MSKNSIYQKKDKNEFFPTPKKIVDDLYEMVQENSNIHTVLDPCCGDGALEARDYDYTLYDIVDRTNGELNVNVTDFLKAEIGRKFDAVIMNPPFGLAVEFISKALTLADDVYAIVPVRKCIKAFPKEAASWKMDWHYAKMFNIRAAVGIVHFKKQSFMLSSYDAVEKFNKDKLPVSKTIKMVFNEANEAPRDKWFIVDRITLTRCERGHQLIQDGDIYKPGDESAFIAICSNINTKKGSHIPRRIALFDSYDDAKAFQQKYIDNADYVRNYMYKHCSNITTTAQIPLL